jgi:hypothetical protein
LHVARNAGGKLFNSRVYFYWDLGGLMILFLICKCSIQAAGTMLNCFVVKMMIIIVLLMSVSFMLMQREDETVARSSVRLWHGTTDKVGSC